MEVLVFPNGIYAATRKMVEMGATHTSCRANEDIINYIQNTALSFDSSLDAEFWLKNNNETRNKIAEITNDPIYSVPYYKNKKIYKTLRDNIFLIFWIETIPDDILWAIEKENDAEVVGLYRLSSKTKGFLIPYWKE